MSHPKLSDYPQETWEREAWAPPPELAIDEWAEANIVLPRSMTAYPGPLNLDVNPYLREVLRATTDPRTEEISLKWATQLGKTISQIIATFYYAANDPWPAIHIMPRDEDAEAINVERYQPVLRESPSMHPLRSSDRWAENKDAIRLREMQVYFTGANSPAGLASRAICLCMMDEVNKWPPWSGKEADPIKLAKERTRWFHNRKIFKTSTPTTEDGFITREYANSTQEKFYVPCPHCRHFQFLVFGNKDPGTRGIKWPADERDPDRIQVNALAWYECGKCHGRILDNHKPAMLREGVWVGDGGEVVEGADGLYVKYPPGQVPNPRHRGFHLWAGYSPMLTWSDIAAEFLRSKDKPETMMNFVNSWLAEEWRQAINELRAPELRARVDVGMTQGQVPKDAWLITGGVDVQRPAGVLTLYYTLRAWGKDEESWLVRCGSVVGWDELYNVLFRSAYRNPAGEAVGIQTVLVDSGDGVTTLEVYDWCSWTNCIPSKGASRPTRQVTWTNVDRAGKQLALCMVNTNYYKTRLHQLARTQKWHLPVDVPEEYFAHMTAEQLVSTVNRKTGRREFVWTVTSAGTPNHLFDTEVLALVGADLLQIPFAKAHPVTSARKQELSLKNPPARIVSKIFRR